MYNEAQIEKVLASAGIPIINRGASDFVVFCPFHNNTRTPAGEINYESGVFFCFSCKHTATLEDFVAQYAGLTYFQAIRIIHKYRNPDSIVDQVEAILLPKPDAPEFPRETVEELNKLALKMDRPRNYLNGRGITTASIEKFKLGYSPKQDMVVFPFMDPDGSRYIGIEARSIEGKDFKTTGPKSSTLFNLRSRIWSNEVFLTESVLDCIRLEQIGAPAVSSMGANRSKAQVALLNRYFNGVYVVQDNDPATNGFAGQVAAAKLVDKLTNRGIIVSPPDGYKDIGEMSDIEVQKLVASTNNLIEGI